MKGAASKLKGLDFKQLAVDHGEKVVVGIVGLIVVVILALGTRWGRYDKSPQELEKQVAAGEQALATSTWPETEAATFNNDKDLTKAVEEMLKPLNVAEYDYSTRMWYPLVPQQQAIQEMDYLPVQQLIATSGKVFLQKAPETPLYPGAETDPELAANDPSGLNAAEPMDDEDIPDSLKLKPNPNRVSGNAFSGGGLGFGGEYGGEYDEGFTEEYDPSMMEEEYGASGEFDGGYGYDPYSMDGGMGMGMGTGVEGMGLRFVGVRGVYPYRKQLERLAKAMNVEEEEIEDLLEIMNFELQRKTAIAGAEDPWSGEWETIDISLIAEVLTDVADYEQDIVDVGVTDQAITMPLPLRVFGWWDDEVVSHPAVKNFELSEQGREAQRILDQKIMQYKEQLQEQQELLQQEQKGGFAAFQYDLRGLREAAYGSGMMTNITADYTADYTDAFGTDAKGNAAESLEEQLKVSAAGSLLLFRALDFTVEPGKTYIYRVRLSLKNPHSGRSIDDLENPAMAQGEYRETDWSNATEPVKVAEDAAFFVEYAEADRVAQDRDGVLDRWAHFDIYQWLPDTGTHIHEVLEVDLGQFIGGKEKTEVIEPAPGKYEERDAEFATGEMLVDVAGSVELNQSLHADLKSVFVKGQPGLLPIPGEALVIDEYGKLVTLDAVSEDADQNAISTYVQQERDVFGYLKNAVPLGMEGYEGEYGEDGGESLDAYAGEYGIGGGEGGEGMGMSPYRMKQMRKRARMGKSPARKMPAGGGYPGGGYPGGGYPGGGYPGGGYPGGMP